MGRPKGGAAGGRAAKSGSARKGAQGGSGGQRRRALAGRGPTLPAELRPGHPAQRQAGREQRKDRSGEGRGAGAEGELVAGRNAVLDALRAAVPSSALLVAAGVEPDPRVDECRKLAARSDVPVREVPRSDLDRAAGRGSHQGIVLRVSPFQYAHPGDLLARAGARPPLLVALDGITDPQNLGAVVRCAAAFGAHGVVVPERRAAGVGAAAWKASAGALARVPVARATNVVRALRDYQAAGLFVVGLTAEGVVDVHDLEVGDGPVVLVIGSEGRGLSRLVTQTCDLTARIPMSRGTDSLNAAVAAGIALAEVARRRAQIPSS
ncbi:MAG: 23S rRNA (guanosine(2251)-2'-O)-methyltransferase RlmB [Frankiaceae bacterium]